MADSVTPDEYGLGVFFVTAARADCLYASLIQVPDFIPDATIEPKSASFDYKLDRVTLLAHLL